MDYISVYLSATFMILVTILFRKYAMGKVPYIVFDILWIMTVVRFFIPIKFESGLSAFNLYYVLKDMIIYKMDLDIFWLKQVGAALSPYVDMIKYILFFVWLVGFIIISMFFYIDYKRGIQIIKNAENCEYDVQIKQWLKRKNLCRKIEIKTSYDINIPVSYGTLKQGILLPPEFIWQKKESEQILLHEYIHIKYFHEFCNIILIALVCINWFHPCIWLLYKYVHRDMEIFCDRQVLSLLGEKEKKSYAFNLIYSAQQEKSSSVVYSNFARSSVKERIEAIMNFKKMSVFAGIVSIMIPASVVTAFATTDVVMSQKEMSGITIIQEKKESVITTGAMQNSIYMEGNIKDIKPYIDKIKQDNAYKIKDYKYIVYEKLPPQEMIYSVEENGFRYEGVLVCDFVKCDYKKEKYTGYYSGILYQSLQKK